MKKKIIIVSISTLLILGIILNINNESKEYNSNNKGLAIYLENDSGNYSKTNSFPLQDSGYTLNISKSVCNGSTNISWNNEEWGLELDSIDRENTRCFLFFDKSI